MPSSQGLPGIRHFFHLPQPPSLWQAHTCTHVQVHTHPPTHTHKHMRTHCPQPDVLCRGICVFQFSFLFFMRSFFQCDTIRSEIVTVRAFTIISSHSDPRSSSTLFLPLPPTPVTISTGFVCILPNFLYENTSIYDFF